MRPRGPILQARSKASLVLALALGLCLAIGASAGVSANVGEHRLAPPTQAVNLAMSNGADAAPGLDDVTALSHSERLALFSKRVAVFRLLHRTRSVAPRRVATLAHQPIVHGSTDQECLTQAVYYEARGEPEEGQVAVAQVVVNRSRAGGRYPKSLCGVVYQGSSRPGCQFSFACEGDRQGGPVQRAAWDRAAAVASKVIAGAAVGDLRATNYHTTAVAPLWDRSIAKLAQIGRHIFFGGRELSQPSVSTLTPPGNPPEIFSRVS
jgi:hypothetical protein